jgi:hypothetical protein
MDRLWWVEIGYSLLLDRAGPVGGSVEHSKGKGGESVVAILRFLCDSPHSCWIRTVPFWPWWQVLSCVLTACRVFMLLDKPSSFCNYYVELHLPTSCGAFTFGGRMRPRAKTSSRKQGPYFDLLGTCEWLSYVRAFGSQAYGVLVRFLPLQGVYRFKSPWHSRLWVAAYRCSYLIVCLVYCW